MIRFHILFFLFTALLYADFISPYEYGEKLYQNPRGISCVKCHGEKGEGNILAKIRSEKREVSIHAKDIRNLSYETLAKALKRGKGVMPVYHLTQEEIKALYIFLNSQK